MAIDTRSEALESSPQATEKAVNISEVPESIEVKGVHAYSEKSVELGQTVNFRVSADTPYKFSIVQLGIDPDSSSKDIVLYEKESPARLQRVQLGSYIKIDLSLNISPPFCAETWIRPFNLSGSIFNGWLTLDKGKVKFAELSSDVTLKKYKWYHIVAIANKKERQLWINGELATRASSKKINYAIDYIGKAFDGDIAQSTIFRNSINISQHYKAQALEKPQGDIIATWLLDEEIGLVINDSSGNKHHGRIINNGTWMVGGPSFNARKVKRFDQKYMPNKDDQRGHALRLATDDLYNCQWPIAHSFKIPSDAKQGIYVGRFNFSGKEYNSTFVVRRPKRQAPKKILVLCATNTWLAYSRMPFADNHKAGLVDWGRESVLRLNKSNSKLPKYNMYDQHKYNQPTFQMGVNMPWPSAGPYKTYRGSQIFSQWTRNERFLHLWLDENSYEYDVITDFDLDRHPSLINGYKTVIISGHSEYWSARAYDAVEKYLDGGGNLAVLSGNSVFWRVSFNEDYTVMECRKYPEGMPGSSKMTEVGQLYHTDDKKRGGLMRFCGYPAWKLIGLETAGWCKEMKFDHYKMEMPNHFLFNSPHKIDLKKGDAFGFVTDKLGCVGHEYDVRLPVLIKASKNPPNIIEPGGILSLARSYSKNKIIDYNANANDERANPTRIISEIIYWEKKNGGRVFNIGSVAAPWGVYKDKNLGLLMNNVLYHFGAR